MNKIFSLIILLNFNLFALSPEVKYDILKTKLTQQLKNQEDSKSIKTIDAIKALGVTIPKSFSYFEGKALYETGDYSNANKKFENYIDTNGKKAKYYRKAIQYLIKVEEKVENALENEKKEFRDKFVNLLESKYANFRIYDGEEHTYFGREISNIQIDTTMCKYTFLTKKYDDGKYWGASKKIKIDFSRYLIKISSWKYKSRIRFVGRISLGNNKSFELFRFDTKISTGKNRVDISSSMEYKSKLKPILNGLNRLCK